MKVFDKFGCTWVSGARYSVDDTKFEKNGDKTIYSNIGSFGSIESGYESIRTYWFDEIDYSEYIAGQEIYELLQDAEITNSELQEYLEETKLPF